MVRTGKLLYLEAQGQLYMGFEVGYNVESQVAQNDQQAITFT